MGWGGEDLLPLREGEEPAGQGVGGAWGSKFTPSTQGAAREEEEGRAGALGFQAAPDTQFSSWVP